MRLRKLDTKTKNTSGISPKKAVFSMVVIILVALLIEMCILYFYVHKNEKRTSLIFLEQVVTILRENAAEEAELVDSLKDEYMKKAVTVAYCIEENRDLGNDLWELKSLAGIMGIDEIHIFDESGTIVSGTVPKYYGYSFDSGEQMAYFKPMLEDQSLTMCQDVTPNTAEAKSMMYAIAWDESGTFMVQVGIEPLRLLEELKSNDVTSVLNNIPSYNGIEIYVIDLDTGKITGATDETRIGANAEALGFDVGCASYSDYTRNDIKIAGKNYHCIFRKTESGIVAVTYSSAVENKSFAIALSIEAVYLVLAGIAILSVIRRLQQAVTEEKKREKELRKAREAAERANIAKTNFLFNMSHDIRTPMNAILGYTDIGLRHAEDLKISRDSYRKIKLSGNHLLELINDILEMSRIESGKLKLDRKPVDIRETIETVTEMSQSLAEVKNIDFETIIGEIRHPYVYTDPLHFNEVIINLISNAVKYTPDGGKVRYTVNETGEINAGKVRYRFEISDTGIGMGEEFQKHLFETFSREENTTVSRIEGTGLGLAIVKKIVDMLRGDIRVKSVRNEGSVFTVELPFEVMDDKEIAELKAEEGRQSEVLKDETLSGKRVLLVEDNELNREIATFILEDAELQVETAEDGSIAVRRISEKGADYYDFVLMDIQMPVMNGYEATRAIRELPDGKQIPIIALSANAFEEDKKKSLHAGMNAHVAKPIDIKVLFETMHELMKQQ